MILLEKKKEAGMRGIRFECDFRYPENTKLDAFDVSVILYNALNNCMESVNGEKPYIRIKTKRIIKSRCFGFNLVKMEYCIAGYP